MGSLIVKGMFSVCKAWETSPPRKKKKRGGEGRERNQRKRRRGEKEKGLLVST